MTSSTIKTNNAIVTSPTIIFVNLQSLPATKRRNILDFVEYPLETGLAYSKVLNLNVLCH